MAAQWKQSESERAQEMGGWDILSSCDFSHQRTASELVPEESLFYFITFFHLFITVHWLLLLWKDIEVNLAIIIVSLKQFLLYSQKSKQRWFCLFFFFFFSIFVWREKKERRNLQHMITYQPLPVCYMKSCVLKPINRDDMCQQTLLKWKNILINKEY